MSRIVVPLPPSRTKDNSWRVSRDYIGRKQEPVLVIDYTNVFLWPNPFKTKVLISRFRVLPGGRRQSAESIFISIVAHDDVIRYKKTKR